MKKWRFGIHVRERRVGRHPTPAVLEVAGLSETRETQLHDDISQHVPFNKIPTFRAYIRSIGTKKRAKQAKKT